jgi:orotidine-5'-phosphate decarboxylase
MADADRAAAGRASAGEARECAARAVAAHCRHVLDAVADQCVAVKLQVACFERLGGPGWEALRATCQLAREHELLVIADAKRGDIDVTASAYAQAFLGHTDTPYGEVPGLDADAVTANPLLGTDSLRPLVETARRRGAGVFVLVRTSNPGAADVQDLELAAGGSVSERLAGLVAQLGEDGIASSGLADVGAVVGATVPEYLAVLRELMPHAILLLPGVGPQGGKVERLGAAFGPAPAAALITVSRGIVEAYRTSGEDPASAARQAAAGLRASAWALAD